MDPTRFQRLRTVYERASELPRGELTPFLEDACGGDAELHTQVRRMLAAETDPGFLARPDEEGAAPRPLPKEVAGYCVRALLGEGGFGVVYLAEQREPVTRLVALKVLHRHRADARSVLRFEAESQTLALLHHAHIAQLYDAGRSEDGLQYFAMEYVDGEPITRYCDKRRLDLGARLELFLRVGAAVQHAHQRGVVHRDLKPGNVLVAEEDGRPRPKVIDFGVAKLLDEATRHGDPVTREGVPLGTPGYMSPEQAAGEPVDTRADVYALGVLLYDLLAGDLPFPRERLASGSPIEVLRIVREQEPRAMSAALLASPETAETVAGRRGCDRMTLLRALRGDLEWIVRRTLAKEPDARYPSVSALLEDVERYRADEPVLAREPAAVYLLRKFVARHRLGVALAATGAVIVAVVIAALAWALRTTSDARAIAVRESLEADRQRDRAVLNEYAAHLAAARAAFEIGDAGDARRHLVEAAPKHRGWEWRHLADRCELSLARIEVGAIAYDVQWLDDEHLLLRLPDRAEVRLAEGGALVRALPFEPELDDLLVDPAEGRLFADARARIEAWSLDGWTPRGVVFEPADFEPPYRWPANDPDVRAMALSPDGRTLYTSENGGAIRAHDLAGSRGSRVVCELDTFCWDVAPLGDGRWLALGTNGGRIEIRRTDDGELVHAPVELARDGVRALVTSRDGETLWAAAGDALHVLGAADGALRMRRKAGIEVTHLALAPDGRTLYGCGAGQLVAWDAATLEVRSRFHGHRRTVLGVAVRPDGERLASASSDGTLRIWPRLARPPVVELDGGVDARSLAVSPDGDAFATADARGRVTVWDAESLDEELVVELGEVLRGCALGAGEVFAVGDRLLAIDRGTGAVREGDAPPARAAALTRDDAGRWLLAVSPARGVLLWQLPELRLAAVLPLPVRAVATFDAERAAFVVGGTGCDLFVIDPERGEVTETIAAHESGGTFTTHGDRIAVTGGGLEVIGGTPGSARFDRAADVIAAAFSNDGTRLATGGWDRLLRLWDLSGTELLVLNDASKPLAELHFVLGGSRLIGRSYLPGTPTSVMVWGAPDAVELLE